MTAFSAASGPCPAGTAGKCHVHGSRGIPRHYQSEPSRSQLVINILERRKAGDSFGCIAHALNKHGIPGEHGGRWYGTTVRNVILRTHAEPSYLDTSADHP